MIRSRLLCGWSYGLLGLVLSAGGVCRAAEPGDPGSQQARGIDQRVDELFARSNLIAWCIVPFDSRKRGPEQRASMLERLGFLHLAYDWREEHIPEFDAEVAAMRRRGISISAWWFPADLGSTSRRILEVLKRNKVTTQLWVSMGDPVPGTTNSRAKVKAAAAVLAPIAQAAGEIGCTVALYNHGGWFGEPENQLAIIDQLGRTNVGIVYNFHHGHEHIKRFGELFPRMQPRLLALNLNGMIAGGDRSGQKIQPLGSGTAEMEMLRVVVESGWRGLIGIIDHREETDSEVTLRENLQGLDWLARELKHPGSGGARPTASAAAGSGKAAAGAPSLAPAFGTALASGQVDSGKPEYAELPITVECRARLRGKAGFNILVANEPKSSATHWELYSYAGSGVFSVYQPGRGGEYKSTVDIGDNRWHHLAAVLEAERVRLYVDGRLVLERPTQPLRGVPVSGGIAFGRLVEGGAGCDGLIDDIRVSRGARIPQAVPVEPVQTDGSTIGLWNFDQLTVSSAPARKAVELEDAAERERLPEFKVVPAADISEMTPASPEPGDTMYRQWHRSHGNAASTRYSALNQVNRTNVSRLTLAWTYHSADGTGNIQCNPVIVEHRMFVPTPGGYLVAVHAGTGKELWRFKPGPGERAGLADAPARRGLVYWAGEPGHGERLLFTVGRWVYAISPVTGKPVEGFGSEGRVPIPTAGTVAGAVYKQVFVVPGFERDVYGFDVRSGRQLWRFHTIPQAGEFGADTWDLPEQGANCWGGMALDEPRGIAFVTTGSPKPDFLGMGHRGQNLFANCVVALDALTGKRLWHFQEVAHDIWDWDIPSPPVLGTVKRNGQRFDVVIALTKLGHTLVLDRTTGKPVFPFRLRRAPVSKLPGESTWPYQPDPEWPEPFVRRYFNTNDVTQRDEESTEAVMKVVGRANYGWFATFEEARPTVIFNEHGGAEWTGGAYDPRSGRVYVNANEIPWYITVFRDDEQPRDPSQPPSPGEQLFLLNCAQCHGPDRRGMTLAPPLIGLRHRKVEGEVLTQIENGKGAMPAHPHLTTADKKALLDFLYLRDGANTVRGGDGPPRWTFGGWQKLLDHEGFPGCTPPWGTLVCLDVSTGRIQWKVPLGEHPEISYPGVRKTGTENFGGPTVTAGELVFVSGTRDKKIRAFDSETGAELWSHSLPWHGTAAPSCYELDGRQYIVVPATGGGKLGGETGDAFVAFALPGARP